MDYSKLRDSTLDSTQDEEAVTVNTRALIDKVLARYSGEWTTLRELLQNAADASATSVTIKFETSPSSTVPTPTTIDPSSHIKHTILHHTLRRLLVSNNGQPFVGNDWSRLKRIAEGNPDETKIGAFGVGFYSVFSECDEPFVTSGKETMAFYWKGNSLFTRKGRLPQGVTHSDTTFMLDYRSKTTTVPNLMSICQFLSTSLTFVGLERIQLCLDDYTVFNLTKKSAPSAGLAIPKDIETKTKDGYMRVVDVECQNAQIDAEWLNAVAWTPTSDQTLVRSTQIENRGNNSAPSLRSFFSRLTNSSSQSTAASKAAAKAEEAAQKAISEDISGTSKATVFIRVNTVNIKCNISSGFASELERATKKPPPKTTKIAILTSSYDETNASLSTLSGAASTKAAEIIASILPTNNGRIFIGFPTAQTTGLLAHISAPSLIPTVERESIDLNARYVRTWNSELLSIAGIACRIAYAGEMQSLQGKLPAAIKGYAPDSAAINSVLPTAVHIWKQYTFREATPLAKAGQIIEEAFWSCNKKHSIEVFSSKGVLPSHEVRIASENLSFVQGIAVVPDQLLQDAKQFMGKIQDFGFISEMTVSDIEKELDRQALTEPQLEEFLKWVAKKVKADDINTPIVQSLFSVTVANILSEENPDSKPRLLSLAQIKTFLNTSRIGPEMPTPDHTMPFRFTKSLGRDELESFGWEDLNMVPWLRWLIEGSTKGSVTQEKDLVRSPAFAAQVLATTSKGWEGLSQSSKISVAEMLSNQTVIPTRLGMRKPAESYFPSVKLFDDLPVATNLNSVKEKFLKALGVRKTIELKVIFDRLMTHPSTDVDKNGTSWSHVDLIRYLVTVWNDIPAQDIEALRNTALCPAEQKEDPSKATVQRYKVAELFEPKADLKALGLPVLKWPTNLNPYASDGKFLKLLGLRSYPSVPELVDLLTKAHRELNFALYENGLQYFVENHYKNNYAGFDLSNVSMAFLPLQGRDNKSASMPKDCFTDPSAEILGFKVLRQDLQSHADKFGVRKNPPMHECALRLIRNPPQNKADAKTLFTYFSTRMVDLSPNVADRLGSAAIVPVVYKDSSDEKAGTKYRHVTPVSCFLGDGAEFGEIFPYVDFGNDPNMFLLRIGSKHEPSTVELARMVSREPARILKTLGVEKYQTLERRLHFNLATLKKDKVVWKELKQMPFLLCYKEKLQKAMTSPSVLEDAYGAQDDEAQQLFKEWHLRRADQIIIVDDPLLYGLFRGYLVAAPQEEGLEELYIALGSQYISTQVEEEPKLGPRTSDQRAAEHLRELILERARLFLHEQPQNTIKHDVKWLEKHLDVQTVSAVSIRQTLRAQNQSYTMKRSANLDIPSKGKPVLSITSSYDLWEVSHEITHLLIDRPRTQTTMVFESFLTMSLNKLRARGYNVDRILRRKETEKARVAEVDRQKQQEVERKRVEEINQPNSQLQLARSPVLSTPEEHDRSHDRSLSGQPQMPGAFHDSPDQPSRSKDLTIPPLMQGLSGGNSIFSNLAKHLKFDGNSQSGNRTQQIQQQANQPPPYSAFDPSQPQGPTQPEPATAPNQIQQNLTRAINASRAFGSSALFSPPVTNTVKEVEQYCDTRPGQNLSLVANSTPGLQIYISNSNTQSNPTSFVAQNSQALNAFAELLIDVAAIFPLPKSNLHVFYDEKGHTIAFNTNGSIFCNFRFFAQLHLTGMNDINVRAQAMIYWWTTLCHELAHNLVGDHSSNHSYYTEQFVTMYFPQAASKIASIMAGHMNAPGVESRMIDGISEMPARATTPRPFTALERWFS